MSPLANNKHEQVAQLIVGGKTPAEAYAYVYGESTGAPQSARRLSKNVLFVARMRELQPIADARVQVEVAKIAQVVENDLMTRVGRAKELYSRILLLRRVILERAAYYVAQEYAANMPGAGTGLIVARHKMIGSGTTAERTIEFELDRGVLSELRECENAMAVELGQRVDKNPAGAYSSLREVPDEVLAQWRAEAATAAAHEAEAAAKALPTDAVN